MITISLKNCYLFSFDKRYAKKDTKIIVGVCDLPQFNNANCIFNK